MIYFLIAFALSIIFTLIFKKIAVFFDITDKPDGVRKKHKNPVPLLGGTAIFLSFWLTTLFLFFKDEISADLAMRFFGVFLGSMLLIFLGYADDRHGLSAKVRLIFSILASFLVILGGVGLTAITNPLGGILPLDFWRLKIGFGEFVVLADLLVFFWIMGMMYTVKILDGLDGLATGVVFIGSLMIFFLSSYTIFKQPDTALMSLVLAGACLGFLLFNFYPAKIYLGEGGGLFLGFILGVLAIISGGKIATALLVMAVPVFDLIRVIISRIKNHQPIFKGDRRHLHFQLLDLGLSETKTVFILYALALMFGLTTLFFPSGLKIITLLFLGLVMFGFGIFIDKKTKKYEGN